MAGLDLGGGAVTGGGPPPDPLAPIRDAAAETKPVTADQFAAQLDEVHEILRSLVPETGGVVRWVDAAGNEYAAPARVPARRQVVIAEALSTSIDQLREMMRGKGLAVADAARKLVTDPAGLDAIDRVFAACHPEPLRAAQSIAGQPEARPSDLFPVEELMSACVPFCVLPLQRVIEAARPRTTRAASTSPRA